MILELIKEIEMKTFEIPVEVGKIDATLSLIQVAAEYCEANVTTSLMIKVESESQNVGNLVQYIGSLEKAGPAPVGKERSVIVKRATRIAKEGDRNAFLSKAFPVASADPEAKTIGYCRNCTETIPADKKGRFCSDPCHNRYAVKKHNLKGKGVELDDLFTVKVGEKIRNLNEAEFTDELHNGNLPEGTRIVTPAGTLKVVVFQGGRLTTNEYFPIDQEVQ
jgi:hypothetical protein